MRCVAVASDFLTADELSAVKSEYAPALESAGVSFADEPSSPVVVLFVATGGTERRVMDLAEARRAQGGGGSANASGGDGAGEPGGCAGEVVLVAYPGRNSLPASLEVLARLQQDGVPGRMVFLDGAGDVDGIERLRVAVSEPFASGVADGSIPEFPPKREPVSQLGDAFSSKPPSRPLDGLRVGLIGEPSDWLVASSPSPELVRDVWGAEVVGIELAEVVRWMGGGDAARGSRRDAARRFSGSFAGGATECREPATSDLEASGRIYVALRSVIEENGLDALTVRCFDLVTGLGATGCLAVSRLTDEGTIAGCEGGLVSELGLLWARHATGETPWMANPARINIATNTLTLAHCTVPCSLVESFALRSHFESGLGAAVAGVLPTGPVTLLRIGGRALDRVWSAHGEITASGCDEEMCRTQVDVRLDPSASVADLLEHPLGNHLVLVRGHHDLHR